MDVQDIFGMDVPDVNKILDNLGFTLEGLEEAMLSQPTFMVKAHRLKIEYTRRRQEAEAYLERLRDDTAFGIRKEARRLDVKVTEKMVEEETERKPAVREAVTKFDQASRLEEWGKGIVSSYFERGSMLKAMVAVRGAEAALESGFMRAELDRLGVQKLREKARQQFPGAEQ
jgi:hypothetical protein